MIDLEFVLAHKDKRFDIKEGNLVVEENGLFTVSTEARPNTIFVRRDKAILLSVDEYIGKEYRRRVSDCVTLVNNFLDKTYGTEFNLMYQNTSKEEFLYYLKAGMGQRCLDLGFKQLNHIEENCILVYDYDDKNRISHIGFVKDNCIYHHIPNKFSCKDPIKEERVLGIYKYDN